MATKKTQKQKEFDLILKYGDSDYELTKRIKTTDLDLIRKYKNKLLWRNIINRDTIKDEFIDEFWDEMKPYIPKIQIHPNMPMKFLIMNREYIDWLSFIYSSSGIRFTVDFIKTFEKELEPYKEIIIQMKSLPKETESYLISIGAANIVKLSHNANISLDLLDMYKDKLDWKVVSKYAKCLSSKKNFDKYEKYIDIYEYTSIKGYHSNIDETKLKIIYDKDFLLKYKDKVNWDNIINYHNPKLVSKINNEEMKITLDFFKDNKNEIDKEVLGELKRYLSEYNNFLNNYANYVSYYKSTYINWTSVD